MASSSSSSTLDSSDETLNGIKLMRLILDEGTEALRNVFKRFHPVSLKAVLSSYKHVLSDLKCRNVLNQNQWDTLYPTPPRSPNINDFDITLLSVLLRNICGLPRPKTGWDSMPSDLDFNTEADVVRIKLFRNNRFAHLPGTAIPADDFKKNWAEISLPLVRLGVDKGKIDKLKNEKYSVFETLVHFDFKKEVQFHLSKYVSETRQWVFEQVSDWFHDENSKNRAFVISSPAGMGKSVVAAVICDRFEKNLAYCHFIQYNNSLYNNPNFLLQSLAWHLCRVFSAYKGALVEKLSGNLGRSLNEMDIEGLFSTLLKELLTNIEEPKKRFLIVIDAVDESENSGRHELANLIANHLHKLPAYIRFVITARPEKILLDKFSKLKPLFIKLDDKRNLNDIKLVLQKNLPCASQPDVQSCLAEKCGGLMLYAYFLTQMYQDENFDESQTSLPGGIDECYEKYLQRLERELGLLGVSNDQFLSFLSALAVAQEPITEAFVESLFQFESNLGTKANVRDTLNSLSSLFLIHEDKSISFFHKSVRDWLVNNDKHRYCIDIKRSHDILFHLCVEKLENLKQQSVTCDLPTDVALRYALKYCIVHFLEGNVAKQKMESFVTNYVTDLQVLFAGVYFDLDLTVNNMYMVTRHDCFQNISDGAKFTLNKLILLLRKSGFILRSYPETFLQIVVNEGGEELSLKASNLLQTRYQNSVYFEICNKHETVDIYNVCCHLSGRLVDIDISPNRDYVVCLYQMGKLELFSLRTGRSEWIISYSSLASVLLDEKAKSSEYRHVVFHPFEQLILPGKLDEVLTFQGTITTGPFQGGEILSERTHFCFSSDGKKMATVHNINFEWYVIVWNVLTGVEEKRFPCRYPTCFSFTTSGNCLGVIECGEEFKTCDLTRDYEVKSGKIPMKHRKVELRIISCFDQNSWLFCYHDDSRLNDRTKNKITVLNSNFSEQKVRYSSFLKTLHVPSTGRIRTNLKFFINNHDESWFSKASTQMRKRFGWGSSHALNYLLMDDKNCAVFSNYTFTIYIVDLERLGNSNAKVSMKTQGFSAISNNGDLVYLSDNEGKSLSIYDVKSENNEGKSLSICDVKSENKRLKSFNDVKLLSLVVVRNGVVIFKDDRTLELWNSDLSKHLSSFGELTGAKKCMFVSDEVIACVISRCVVFFNVVTKKIVHRMDHYLVRYTVLACSVRYHVFIRRYLTKKERFRVHLLKNEREVERAYEVFKEAVISNGRTFTNAAQFSPDGDKLVIYSENFWEDVLDIFNVDHDTVQFIGRIPTYVSLADNYWLRFFDNEKLVSCCGTMMYFFDVKHVKTLTCLDVGNIPESVSVCQQRQIICLGYESLEKFEIIQICRQRCQ